MKAVAARVSKWWAACALYLVHRIYRLREQRIGSLAQVGFVYPVGLADPVRLPHPRIQLHDRLKLGML